MKKSQHDGQPVTYTDHLRITHTGTVVGQSNDGQWLYCQSDKPSAPSVQWHFKVAADWFTLVKA